MPVRPFAFILAVALWGIQVADARDSFSSSSASETFKRFKKMGVKTPLWFLYSQAPVSPDDTTRPKTPLDKTASMQINLVFDANADRPKSCEVLMTNASDEASAGLCETTRKTMQLAPAAVQTSPSQRNFWIHVYTEGDVSQLTMTEPVLSPAKP